MTYADDLYADRVSIKPIPSSPGWFRMTFYIRDGGDKRPQYTSIFIPSETMAVIHAESGTALGIPAASEVIAGA